jgi:hypothetical protein
MEALKPAMEKAGLRLAEVSGRFGCPIRLDPDVHLSRDAAQGLRPPDAISANGQCRLIRAADGWLAVNLPREEDLAAVPAWLECPAGADPWQTITAEAAHRPADALLERAILLHLPIAKVGEAAPLSLTPAAGVGETTNPAYHNVIDLSALWAGPACGGLLAEAGFPVIRIESPNRADPTPHVSPQLDARLNGGKRRLSLEPRSAELHAMLGEASVLITSGRPHALARMGLEPDALFARNPRLVWVAITAHGWAGDAALRVGFGDDCAAAGGLVQNTDTGPHFLGDALADPLTGLLAAISAMESVAAGQSGLLDFPLARCAAWFAQEAGMA